MAKPNTTPERQINLFVQNKDSPDPFRKPVQVVHAMPHGPLTTNQRKIFNNWLKKANSTEPDADGFWTVRIDELQAAIDFNSNNRKFLKDSASALQRVVFSWDVITPDAKKAKWLSSVMFPDIELTSSTMRFRISEQIKPHVINPEIYALIDETVVRKFRRVASIGIYEHCVRFQRLSITPVVKWQTFRDMVLGQSAGRKTYEQYKVFKAKVLNPSIAEVNAEGAIIVELRETKCGKSVEGVFFKVLTGRAALSPVILDDDQNGLVMQMVKLSVLKSEAIKFIKEYSQDAIKTALHYTNDRKNSKKAEKLENPAAYFRMALQKKWASNSGITDVEPKSATTAVNPKKDIAALYRVQRIADAEKYFSELDAADQGTLVARYNEQQVTAGLTLKSRTTKASQAAFFQWLMKDLWGLPSSAELLDFAQTLLAAN